MKHTNLIGLSVGSMSAYNDEEQEVHDGWDATRLGLVRHYTTALHIRQVSKLRAMPEGMAAEEDMMGE